MENSLVNWLSEQGISTVNVMQILFSLMISILFIQSGLDKVFNWQGERDFYKSHFKDTLLNGTAPFLMPVITLSELAAGFLSGIGLLVWLFTGHTEIALAGMLMACLSIIQLFLGQRVAKDYAGAAVLVPYFLLAAAGVYFYLL
ncbi:MAG: DoxX family membrane protein [Lewinellaceae bacterium]|nr:DoxX family membrane protein [Lewinellaceae bacterium]